MDKVFIKDMQVVAEIENQDQGVSKLLELLISADLFTDTREAALHDDVRLVVNYEKIAIKIRSYVQSKKWSTEQFLADELANLCLGEQMVQKVLIKIKLIQEDTFLTSTKNRSEI